jgi:hypothetical protein
MFTIVETPEIPDASPARNLFNCALREGDFRKKITARAADPVEIDQRRDAPQR